VKKPKTQDSRLLTLRRLAAVLPPASHITVNYHPDSPADADRIVAALEAEGCRGEVKSGGAHFWWLTSAKVGERRMEVTVFNITSITHVIDDASVPLPDPVPLEEVAA